MTQPPLLVNVRGAAELLGVGRRTIFSLRARGELPPPVMLASRAIRYRVADLVAWAAARPAVGDRPEPEHLAAGRARKRGVGSAGSLDHRPAEPHRARGCDPRAPVEPTTAKKLKPTGR